MAKNVFVAYLLYFIGGFCGLHQLYLNRGGHALSIFTTFGALCGLGIIRDLFWIPTYVRDANDDEEFVKELGDKMRRNAKPPFSWARYGGMLLVGMIWGSWFLAAVPEDDLIPGFLNVRVLRLLMPAVCSLGVWVVGNIGHQRGDLKPALIASYVLYIVYGLNDKSVTTCTLSASSAFNHWSKQWRRTPKSKVSFKKQALTVITVVLIYYGVIFSYFYFNCAVKDHSGVETKCRDAFSNFFQSPAWRDFKVQLGHLWNYGRTHGWAKIWQEIINSIDPLGEKNALEVLGVNSSATQEDITSAYRKLSRKWHPDRYHDDVSKAEAQEKFIEIQQAYEKLSDIKAKRRRQNRKSQDETKTAPEENAFDEFDDEL